MRLEMTPEEHEQEVLFYEEDFQLGMYLAVRRYADALIEIAAAFERNYYDEDSICLGCGYYMSDGCPVGCLLARRALGVA